jgi:hypothetical protein
MAEGDPTQKSEVGEDLIRSIFESAAIAEDPERAITLDDLQRLRSLAVTEPQAPEDDCYRMKPFGTPL